MSSSGPSGGGGKNWGHADSTDAAPSGNWMGAMELERNNACLASNMEMKPWRPSRFDVFNP